MYCYDDRNGQPLPARAPVGAGKPGSPGGGAASSSPGGPAAARRIPGINERLRQPGAFELLKVADVIYAVDFATGDRCGLFYGDPAIESQPIDPDSPFTWPAVVEYAVDRETNDLDSLAGAVWLAKGSCSFVADLRKDLEEPGMAEAMVIAEIIYAVDGATGERCGLFYGDPATETLPIYDLEPWLAPAVLQVRVNVLSDDREVLARAVRRVKGSCCYPPDCEDGGH